MSEALDRAVIKHWQRLLACTTADDVEVEGYHDWSCAYCRQYLDNDCQGCPIFEDTGQEGCHGTPYYLAFEKLRAWQKSEYDISSGNSREHEVPFPKIEIQAELDYLIDLTERRQVNPLDRCNWE